MSTKYPIVLVVWDDAAGHDDMWLDKVITKPELIHSVGFLLLKSKEYLVIAQDLDADGKHNGRSQIPIGMVKKIKVLRRVNGAP